MQQQHMLFFHVGPVIMTIDTCIKHVVMISYEVTAEGAHKGLSTGRIGQCTSSSH